MNPKTSTELIGEAIAAHQPYAALADGDAWVDSRIFADRICPHAGCTAVFDSRAKSWLNGRVNNRIRIETRDNWCYEPCPKHSQLALS